MASLALSVAEAKEYLRVDTSEEDALISSLILAAQAHCADYLQADLPEELPAPIKQAMFLLVGHFYEQRVGEDIPQVVYVLLSPYRAHLW